MRCICIAGWTCIWKVLQWVDTDAAAGRLGLVRSQASKLSNGRVWIHFPHLLAGSVELRLWRFSLLFSYVAVCKMCFTQFVNSFLSFSKKTFFLNGRNSACCKPGYSCSCNACTTVPCSCCWPAAAAAVTASTAERSSVNWIVLLLHRPVHGYSYTFPVISLFLFGVGQHRNTAITKSRESVDCLYCKGVTNWRPSSNPQYTKGKKKSGAYPAAVFACQEKKTEYA